MRDEAIRPLLDALHETASAVSSAGAGAAVAPGALVGGVLLRALRDPAQRAAILARTRYQEVSIPEWDLTVSTPVDAIRCLVNGAWLRMPVTYDEQVDGCNLLGLISPTAQIVDAIRAAQIETSLDYNYTPYVVAGVLFLLLTIPMARFTDWLARRQGLHGGMR